LTDPKEAGFAAPGIVVYGAAVSAGEASQLLHAGVRGVHLKTAELSSLIACLRTVAMGRVWMEESILIERRVGYPKNCGAARPELLCLPLGQPGSNRAERGTTTVGVRLRRQDSQIRCYSRSLRSARSCPVSCCVCMGKPNRPRKSRRRRVHGSKRGVLAEVLIKTPLGGFVGTWPSGDTRYCWGHSGNPRMKLSRYFSKPCYCFKTIYGRNCCGLAAGELTGSPNQRVRSALFKRNLAACRLRPNPSNLPVLDAY
jgi:hypothetical protein